MTFLNTDSHPFEGLFKNQSEKMIADNNFIQISTNSKTLISRSFENRYGFDNVSQNELIPEKENVFRIKGQEGSRYSFVKDSLNKNYNLIIQINKNNNTATYVENNVIPDLTAYAGTYYSVELKKTYNFEIKDKRLIANNFLHEDNIAFVPLKKNLLGYDQGHLIFHRYSDGTIRDFKFLNESLDAFTDSIFGKEQ